MEKWFINKDNKIYNLNHVRCITDITLNRFYLYLIHTSGSNLSFNIDSRITLDQLESAIDWFMKQGKINTFDLTKWELKQIEKLNSETSE